MVNVTSRHCAHDGCIRQPNFHHLGNVRGMYCCTHKQARRGEKLNLRHC